VVWSDLRATDEDTRKQDDERMAGKGARAFWTLQGDLHGNLQSLIRNCFYIADTLLNPSINWLSASGRIDT
jgi:hypothetical protein